MRCVVCGRPYDGGTLNPGEPPCQGCREEIIDLMSDTDNPMTQEQAHQQAKTNHEKREIRTCHAALIVRCKHLASGKSGDGDGKALKPFNWQDKQGLSRTLTVADQKAQAVKTLAKLERQEAMLLEAVETQ